MKKQEFFANIAGKVLALAAVVMVMGVALTSCSKDDDPQESKLGENQISVNAKVRDIKTTLHYYGNANDPSEFVFGFTTDEGYDELGTNRISGGISFDKELLGKTVDLKNPSLPQNTSMHFWIHANRAGLELSYMTFGNQVEIRYGDKQITDTSLLKSGSILVSHSQGKGYSVVLNLTMIDGTSIELKAFVKESDAIQRT